MIRQGGGSAFLGGQPFGERHGASLGQPKPNWQVEAKRLRFSIRLPMKDAERRARFVAWFERVLKNNRAELMRRTGLTKGRVAQLVDSNQPFGERAAARLAIKLRLPEDYFERADEDKQAPPPPPTGFADRRRPPSESEWAMLEAIRAFPQEERDKIRNELRGKAEYWERIAKELLAGNR